MGAEVQGGSQANWVAWGVQLHTKSNYVGPCTFPHYPYATLCLLHICKMWCSRSAPSPSPSLLLSYSLPQPLAASLSSLLIAVLTCLIKISAWTRSQRTLYEKCKVETLARQAGACRSWPLLLLPLLLLPLLLLLYWVCASVAAAANRRACAQAKCELFSRYVKPEKEIRKKLRKYS